MVSLSAVCVCVCVMELRRGLPCAEFAFRTFSFPCQSNVATHRVFFLSVLKLLMLPSGISMYRPRKFVELCWGYTFPDVFFCTPCNIFPKPYRDTASSCGNPFAGIFLKQIWFYESFSTEFYSGKPLPEHAPKIQAQAVIKWHFLLFFLLLSNSLPEENLVEQKRCFHTARFIKCKSYFLTATLALFYF